MFSASVKKKSWFLQKLSQLIKWIKLIFKANVNSAYLLNQNNH